MIVYSTGSSDDKLKLIFNMYDYDKNGKISNSCPTNSTPVHVGLVCWTGMKGYKVIIHSEISLPFHLRP